MVICKIIHKYQKHTDLSTMLGLSLSSKQSLYGKFLRHGEGYPDLSLRLFDRRYAKWSNDSVHEKVITSSTVGTLQGDLMHESGEDIALYLSKQNRYTTLQALTLHTRGKKAGTAKLVFSPILRFFKFYIFKQGFRDGLPGFVHITIGCMNSFIKYAKLRELTRLKSLK